MTTAAPHPALRSVLADGAARGRADGTCVDFILAPDGRSVALIVERPRVAARAVAWLSLDDGRQTGAPDEPPLLTYQGEGAGVRWFHRDGSSGVLPDVSAGSVVASSPVGPLLAVLAAGEGQWLVRVIRARDGAKCGAAIPVTPNAFHAVMDERHLAVVTRFARGEGRSNALFCLRFEDGHLARAAVPHEVDCGVLRFERGGGRLLLNEHGVAILYDPVSLRTLASLDVPGHVLDFASGRLLAGGGGPPPRLAVRSLEAPSWRTLPLDAGQSLRARLTPDGATVVSFDTVLRAFDVGPWRARDLRDGPEVRAQSLAWSGDGARLAVLLHEGVVRVHDLTTGSLLWELEGMPGAWWTSPLSARLAFSPDGRSLHAVTEREVVTWSLATGQEVHRAALPRAVHPGQVACAPDGRRIAVLGVPERRGLPLTLSVVELDEPARNPVHRELFPAADPTGLRLDYVGAEGLRVFARHANNLGMARVERLEHARARPTCTQRGLPAGLQALPFGDGPALVALRKSRVGVASLLGAGEWRGEAIEGLALARLLDVRGRGAALVHDDGTSYALVLLDVPSLRVCGVSPLARTVREARVAPDGARVAVVYLDGGVETFAADERPSG